MLFKVYFNDTVYSALHRKEFAQEEEKPKK